MASWPNWIYGIQNKVSKYLQLMENLSYNSSYISARTRMNQRQVTGIYAVKIAKYEQGGSMIELEVITFFHKSIYALNVCNVCHLSVLLLYYCHRAKAQLPFNKNIYIPFYKNELRIMKSIVGLALEIPVA
jgi:hypothetical protein